MAKLTTHVLDTANGVPAQKMTIELWSRDGDKKRLLRTVVTNADGRSDAPLLTSAEMKAGEYELVFFVGDYFSKDATDLTRRFLDKVPIRFRIIDTSTNYHVPLLCSPWSYSTYRGS